MSSNYLITVGTAVVASIGLRLPAALQRKIHDQDVRSINIDEVLFVVRDLHIIPKHSSLPYLYKSKNNSDIPASLGALLPSEMHLWDLSAFFNTQNASVDEDDDDAESVNVRETFIPTI